MSLDFSLMCPCCENILYAKNITHNLNKMAQECGAYQVLWRPEEINMSKAREIATILIGSLAILKAEPGRFKKLNPENGWGKYEDLIVFIEETIRACEKYPNSDIYAHR